MRKLYKYFLLLLFTFLFCGNICCVQAASDSDSVGRLVTKGGITRYRYPDGQFASDTWITIENKQYYFSETGTMVTGWQKIKKNWYYFKSNGVLKTNMKHSQHILVKSSGSYAKIYMLSRKKNGKWKQILATNGRVGRNGAGKTREGMGKTPTGTFTMGRVFGIRSNPGCKLPYTQIRSEHYWVDDPSSRYYNKFVNSTKVTPDWSSAEHLIDYSGAYDYAVAINYNSRCIPGKGSAIFLHCMTNGPTAGCVSVPRSAMIKILKKLHADAKITIY